jgi:hypothetical protein
MDDEDALLKEIEAFLTVTGMSHDYFGKQAANNSRLVERLRKRGRTPTGREQSVTYAVGRRVRQFIAAETKRRELEAAEAAS